ncbi:MAG TPA: sigma 54-interacting transcriptional regulator [Polyangiaceae bacterium]|nr:sigma 54-interacting transcriptional regulator [Polyangiaceae bacterium]
MSSHKKDQPSGRTTAESKSTARPSERPFIWALHWVFPEAKIVRLRDGNAKIGRAPECASVLSDSEVSREHALLSVRGTLCEISDLRSRNGVHVDGVPVNKALLRDGSVLRLGGTVGVLVYSPDAELEFAPLLNSAATAPLGSGKLKWIVEQARALAHVDGPVYIHGESGTGKEAIAEILHQGRAKDGQFVALNCSALRGELASPALFGHVKGAFSGATQSSQGAARAAHGGTLFLDEIAELSPEIQPLLLRLLENGQITPLGQSQAQRVDVRVVSASHEDLFALCRSKRFREDLYFRLTTHQLRLPPLRERREDILGLFQAFSSRPTRGLSASFVEALLCLPLPGNVRELKNLAAGLRAAADEQQLWHAHLIAPASHGASEPTALDWKALNDQHGGVATRIARATGIPVTTVKRHLAKNGLRG